MNDKYNFLKTTFPETADQLMKLGFELVSKSGSTYIFLNKGIEGKLDFDKKKVIPTNILYT